jgi:hypothetical protein
MKPVGSGLGEWKAGGKSSGARKGIGSMRFLIVSVAAFSVFLGAGLFQPPMMLIAADGNQEGALKEACRVADELGDKIRGLLFKELQRGGPVGAVSVCSEVAQEITRDFKRQSGHHARRVSMRYRNPQNRPDGYEQRVLARMEMENGQKQLAKEYVEVVKDQGVNVLRYMRPLIVAPACIACHGARESMAPEVRRLLAERYPEDLAFGFQEGDFRGAISVQILLNPTKTE